MKTREEKIKECLETVEDWDIETLIAYAQEAMEERLKKCTDDQVDMNHEHTCSSV